MSNLWSCISTSLRKSSEIRRLQTLHLWWLRLTSEPLVRTDKKERTISIHVSSFPFSFSSIPLLSLPFPSLSLLLPVPFIPLRSLSFSFPFPSLLFHFAFNSLTFPSLPFHPSLYPSLFPFPSASKIEKCGTNYLRTG